MTLTEYCTGVANAIREKEGSTGAIPAPQHAARILALETGGKIEVCNVTFQNFSGDTVYYANGNGEVASVTLSSNEVVLPIAKNTLFWGISSPFGYEATGGVYAYNGSQYLSGGGGLIPWYAIADGTVRDTD